MENHTKLRILIVEDEFVTIDLLRNIIQDLGHEVSGDAMSADEALSILELKNTDLVLLDINLKGDHDGVWLSKVINKNYGLPFLFITAYSDSKTINKAIDSNPFGYLVKPIRQNELYIAISLIIKGLKTNKKSYLANTKLENEEDLIEKQTHVFVKSGFSFCKIPFDQIIYIQSFKNYLEINHGNSKTLVRKKLGEFLSSLPNDNFLQVHRSYVINLNYVEEITDSEVTVKSIIIPLSKQFKQDLKLKLLK